MVSSVKVSVVVMENLPNPTTDDIEVHIRSLQYTYQDAIILLLEIYIQQLLVIKLNLKENA